MILGFGKISKYCFCSRRNGNTTNVWSKVMVMHHKAVRFDIPYGSAQLRWQEKQIMVSYFKKHFCSLSFVANQTWGRTVEFRCVTKCPQVKLFGPIMSNLIGICQNWIIFSYSSFITESVYDLLPKELQLQPSSTQRDPPTMSQKSGGEVGPPPSATLASGELSAQSIKTTIWDQFLTAILFPKQMGVKKVMWHCVSVWAPLHTHKSKTISICG